MKWKMNDKALATIKAVAPGLAAALGGPLAGAAAGALVAALGGDPKAAEDALIAQSPETLLALRKAEQEFAIRMRDLDIEPERIAASDRANARDLAKVNMKPQMIISATFLGGYFLVLILRMAGWFDAKDDKVVDNLLTALTYGVPLILAF